MSSISDAIARLRPDLNRQTKFQRGGGVSEKSEKNPDEAMGAVYVPGDDLPLPEFKDPGLWDRFLGGALASGRSRVLACLLGALTLGIGVSFFPSVNPVRGKSGNQEADVAEAGGATLAAAASAEIDHVASGMNGQPAAAVPVPTPQAKITPPPAPNQPEVIAVLNVKTKPVAEKPMQVQLQLRRPQASTATLVQPARVADSMPIGEAVALASTTGGAVEIADETLEMAAADRPGAEVLYEAMPSPELGDEPPADERQTSTRRSASRSPQKSAPPRDEVTLSGIFWDKTNPMAMINGEIVEVGQTIAGAKILEIGPESVTVERNGRRQSLTL